MDEAARVSEAGVAAGDPASLAREGRRLDDAEVERRLAALDRVLERVETMVGEEGEISREALTQLVAVYGEALARAVSVCATSGDAAATGRALAGDPLLGHLMALHGIHPDPPELRVQQMLAGIREQLGQAASVELEGIDGGVAQVRLSASGCSAKGLGDAVRDLLLAEAPELGGVETFSSSPPAFIPVDSLGRRTR